jgi:EmrB/QacA subfamily drug resistance transporter
VLCGAIMTILDSTIVNIAIPTLQKAFGVANYTDIAWVVTAYLLAQGMVIPASGWATDRFGTKRLYIITLVLFTVASALCGVAPNLGMLIFFRVLQGIGGGMIMPIGMTIILRAVGPQEMGKVMGIFGVPMLIAPALGPVLGGWFVQDFTWRLIFYVNVPIGVLGVVSAWRLLKETPTGSHHTLDWIGLLTATPAVLALLYAVDQSSTLGWGSSTVIALLVAAAVFLAVFVLRQLHTDEPLMNLSLFKDTTFSASMLLSFLIVTGLFGGMLLLPIFLQTVHGMDPLTTGLLLLPQALTAMAMMPLGGMLTDRFGPRPVVITGLIGMTISGVVLAQLHAETSMWVLTAGLVLRGIGMGLSMMPAMSAALARVPRHLTSRASSVTNTLQRVGSSLGIAILVTFLGAQITTAAAQANCNPSPATLAAAARIPDAPSPVTAASFCAGVRAQASANSAGTSQSTQAPRVASGNPALDAFFVAYGNEVQSIAFDRTFAFISILSVVGFIPALFLKRPERDPEVDHEAVPSARPVFRTDEVAMPQKVSDGSNITLMGIRIADAPPAPPPRRPGEQQLRAAWRASAEATADEAALGSAAHRVAADRDRWIITTLVALSSAVAAFAGFSGINAFLSRTQVSVACIVAAVLAAVVAGLVNNSHRADHETAARSYATLQHDAEDFRDVTAMNTSFDDARTAFLALIALRDRILDTVTPIAVQSPRSAERRPQDRPDVRDTAADAVPSVASAESPGAVQILPTPLRVEQVVVTAGIRAIAELHEGGILTDAEFSAKKADLLSRI